MLNQVGSSKSRGGPSKQTLHSNSTESHGTAQLAYSRNDRKLPEHGSLEVAGAQQASRSSTGSQACLSMQKLQQTPPTEFTGAHLAANAMPAASHAGTMVAVTPQPALGAAAASAEASIASQAEPESAFANAVKANEPAQDPEQLVGMPVVKALVQCSGTGCQDVLVMCQRAKPASRVRQPDSWVSRSFRGEAHSSCTLQLLHKNQTGICIKVCQTACLDTSYNFLPTLSSEKKRKDKTTRFGDSLSRSQVVHLGCLSNPLLTFRSCP